MCRVGFFSGWVRFFNFGLGFFELVRVLCQISWLVSGQWIGVVKNYGPCLLITLIGLDFFRNHVRWPVLKSTNPCFRLRALMPEVAEQYLFLKLNLFLYLFEILND